MGNEIDELKNCPECGSEMISDPEIKSIEKKNVAMNPVKCGNPACDFRGYGRWTHNKTTEDGGEREFEDELHQCPDCSGKVYVTDPISQSAGTPFAYSAKECQNRGVCGFRAVGEWAFDSVVSPAKKTVEDIRDIPLLEVTWKSWDEEREIDLGNGDPVILASNCEVTHIGSGYERIGEIVSDINSARQDGMTYDLHGSENRAFVKEHDEIMIHIPDGMVYLEPKTA